MRIAFIAIVYVALALSAAIAGWAYSRSAPQDRKKLPGHAIRGYAWDILGDITPEQREAYRQAEIDRWDRALAPELRRRADTLVLELEKPFWDREREFAERVALPRDEAIAQVEKFSAPVTRSRIRTLMDKTGVPDANGIREFLRRTKNRDPDFYYPVTLCPEIGASCSQYALYLMRRENPLTFVDPHNAPEPLGVLLAQGYMPVMPADAADNDLVFYFRYKADAPQPPESGSDVVESGSLRNTALVYSSHYGVVRDGQVISKDVFGYVTHHSFLAGGQPGWRYMVFRKPFDAASPIPQLDKVEDYYVTDLCVTTEAYAYPLEVEESVEPRIAFSCFCAALALALTALVHWRFTK